jgi:2-haloacid dehalogenase
MAGAHFADVSPFPGWQDAVSSTANGMPMTLFDTSPTGSAPSPRVVAFDAYGTLFDVHSAVMRHASRIGPGAAQLSDTWRAKQLEYSWVRSLIGAHRDFWRLTQEALDFALAKFPLDDATLRADLRADLLAAYRVLDAYPDAEPLLDRLRARGFPTAILSNGEPGMLAAAAESSGLAPKLDRILSIEACGVFKTAPATYALVTDAFACEPAQVLFVSSNRWDIAGAGAFGFRCIWINRAGNPDEYADLAPMAVLRDLARVG